MPPHAQMSLAQQQLLLALVARFWKAPYERELVRWGTLLHDRFMLPHFVWQDLAELIRDMNQAGYPLELDWFAPHFEFRFPRYGEIRYGDMTLELRQALEPWHVMGEEGAPGGTVRYVDSSLERLQVKVTGYTSERFVIACNGCAVPMRATGCERRIRRRHPLPGVASRQRACIRRSTSMRRWCSMCTIAGRSARWLVARITSRILEAGTLSISR